VFSSSPESGEVSNLFIRRERERVGQREGRLEREGSRQRGEMGGLARDHWGIDGALDAVSLSSLCVYGGTRTRQRQCHLSLSIVFLKKKHKTPKPT
jgi:hypothetical protein